MATDQVVSAKTILQSQAELQRRGTRRVYSVLENTERDMTELILEQTTTIYHQVLKTGATPKEARRIHHAAENLVLVCVLALQKAHQEMWQEGTGQELTRRLNPPLGSEPAPRSAPDAPEP